MKKILSFSQVQVVVVSVVMLGWVLSFAAPASAQTPFALENIGQKIDSDDARMVGRGGWGMAVVDSMHPGFKNIAGLSSLRHIALKYTGYGEQIVSDSGDESRTAFRTISPDIRVGIPVMKGRLAVTAGFKVGRSMQYNSMSDTSWFLGGDVSADSISVSRQFKREGTMLTVPLGVAYEVKKGLSIGATLGLANGTIRETLFHDYIGPLTNDGNALYSPSKKVQEDHFSGLNATFSFVSTGWDRVHFGASYSPGYTLDVERKSSLGGVGYNFEDTYEIEIPVEYSAGFEAQLNSRWLLGADFQLQEFENFNVQGPRPDMVV